jgi:NAD(P)-dependent dehydrogenase (short-subunit alcohol dehydrogenase family)
MNLEMSREKTLVTGGASGIGDAKARFLLAEGSNVVVACIDKAGLEKHLAETKSFKNELNIINAYLASSRACGCRQGSSNSGRNRSSGEQRWF